MKALVQRRIKKMIVEANSRTIPRSSEDFLEIRPELREALREVEEMHERGEFADAASLLVTKLPEEVVYDDPWVTNALGLSLSQNGQEEEAWPFFTRSEQIGLAMAETSTTDGERQRGLERAARAATNLAISLKKLCSYDAAIAVAERAINHAPWFWPAYTSLVAALEGRGTREDQLRSHTLLDVAIGCTGASQDPQFWNAIKLDADFVRIRRDDDHFRQSTNQNTSLRGKRSKNGNKTQM
jgi:tetratricopeptide (TPR) repeat protein